MLSQNIDQLFQEFAAAAARALSLRTVKSSAKTGRVSRSAAKSAVQVVTPKTQIQKKIYVLLFDGYTDNRHDGIYTTRELAEEAQTLYPNTRIDEYDLDVIPEHPPGTIVWVVDIEDSAISRTDIDHPMFCPSEIFWPPCEKHNGAIRVYCWAVDKEHANKIALDKYHQYQIANKQITKPFPHFI